jgi:type I restriction enzyme S subunit
MNDVPAYWKMLPLKELVITRKGKKPLKLSEKPFKDSVSYLDIDAIENDNIKQYADSLTTLISTIYDIFIVADGSRSGLVKRGMNGAVGSTILCITPLAINVDYLYYYLLSKFEYLNKNTTGASIPHLNQGLLLNMIIPIPPPEEQNLIAKNLKDKLDQYQNDFINAKQELLKIDKFKQSVLEKAFNGHLTKEWRKIKGDSYHETKKQLFALNKNSQILENNALRTKLPRSWIITDTESICIKITDGEHQTPKRQINGELLLTAKNVRDGFIDYDNVEYIDKEDFEKSRKRCDPSIGDVLVVSVGATIGRCSVIREKTKFALVRSVLLFKPLIDGEYLMYCFQSPILQDIISESSTGVAQQSLYINKASNLPIPFPSREEQKEIVNQINKHFFTALLIEEKTSTTLKRIDDLQRSIFQIAFSGQLASYVAPSSEEWFKELLSQIKFSRESFRTKSKKLNLDQKIANKKFKEMISNKKSIVESIEITSNDEISASEAWRQSCYYEKMDIEGFYEELEKVSKKNSSGKIVEWGFSDKEKNNVILKFK